ncbi:MAG: N-acetylmuramoyl-L-alanine amidase [Chitinophagaceae bacterium]
MIRIIIAICLLFSLSAESQNFDENKILVGKTIGKQPYLDYGLGGDRLGGAKMTNLDTGILVQAVDSTIGRYKIQLSKNRSAWLPKANFQQEISLKPAPYYLTGSFLVNGDDKYDFISLSLDEKLPYTSIQQINPSRIVIDIFGATSNTNWVTHRTSAKEIKNVYHEQLEDDVFRVIIELKHKQHWGYSIYYEGKKLFIKVKRQPEDLSLDNMKIAIDAGHGGNNPGAAGIATKIGEKNYTLLIAKQIENALLEKEAKVYMTRRSDMSLSMYEREEMIGAEDPDFMISVHLNSSVRQEVKGVSTYYRYIGFRPLTQYIQESMIKIEGLEDFGNIGSFNFALSGPTDYPNCLLEVAFLSNRDDEKLILDPEFHKQVAKQVVEGIKDWLKSCKEKDD